MKIALPEKWIETGTAGDRTSDVAVDTLQDRLGAVFQLLPLAAENAEEDIEYIHQLRVWSRRATTALTLYEDLMPRRIYSWMKKRLKRIRQAANYARDCDILIAQLSVNADIPEVNHRLEDVREEREHAQKEVVAVFERMSRNDRAVRRVDELLRSVRSRGEKSHDTSAVCFGNWARKRLRPFVKKFFRAVPSDKTDVSDMHQFRIRGKKLRYAMELLPSAFPDEFRTVLYPTIEAMQDRLGEINDLAMAKVRLQRKLELVSEVDAAAWRILIDREQARFVETTQQFWNWCTPQKLRELREGFVALLGNPSKANRSNRTELLRASSESAGPFE